MVAPGVGGGHPVVRPCRAGWRWEFRGLRPRCRSEDRRSLGSTRFFSGGDGSFAAFGRDAGLKTGVPGLLAAMPVRRAPPGELPSVAIPSLRCAGVKRHEGSQMSDIYFVTPDGWVALRQPCWLLRRAGGEFRPRRCRSEDRRSWRGGRWEFRGLRPRCRSEDRRSWPFGRDAGPKGPTGQWGNCPRSSGGPRASPRGAMGVSRPAAAMPV